MYIISIYYIVIITFIIIIIIIIIIAIDFSPGNSNPYTSTDKTNKNKIYIKETIQNTVHTLQNTINTSAHITKTHTQL